MNKNWFLMMFVITAVSLQCQMAMADAAVKVQSFVDMIPESTGNAVIVGGLVIEVALRLFKTEKPVSILRVVSKSIRIAAGGLIKVCDFIDAILPQRVEGQSLIGHKQ